MIHTKSCSGAISADDTPFARVIGSLCGGTATFARLHNMATDMHEDTFVNSQYPALVTELEMRASVLGGDVAKASVGRIRRPQASF